MLFKDAPDLMNEFKDFLPDAMNPPSTHTGLVGILPNPAGGSGTSASWAQGEGPSTGGEKSKSGSRRRKRPNEKDPPPVPPAAAGQKGVTISRVSYYSGC